LLHEEHCKCLPDHSYLNNDTNDHVFVFTTDQTLDDKKMVEAELKQNEILLHPGNHHEFFGRLLALRKENSISETGLVREEIRNKRKREDSAATTAILNSNHNTV
jgi:hypothetical protein